MIQSYPWYIADWRDSETRISLNLAERGLYRELLDYCYLEGSLPADRDKIKLLSGADGHDFARAWSKVEHLFELISTPNGKRLIHRKVSEVRLKLEAYHEQKKHAGSKSGQARRERSLNGRSEIRRTDAEPIPSPTPTPDPSPSTTTPAAAVATVITQHEYPLTLAEIRKHDAAVDSMFCVRLADTVARAVISDPTASQWPPGRVDKAVSDSILAKACRESYATPGRNGKHGAGLLLTTVPRIVINGRTNYV